MTSLFFTDREQAGWMLVERLRAHGTGRDTEKPIVLAIPRGGVEVGAALARGLGCELDVVLSRKLRAPHQPELALGAVSETGEVYLNHFASAVTDAGDAYIEAERLRQLEEIARRKAVFRGIRPQADVRGRTVIVTDDGLATGATMIAALRGVKAAGAAEIIVAVPVAAPDRLEAIRPLCDRIECLVEPTDFWAVGQFYRRFDQVSDDRVCELLRDFGLPATKWDRGGATAPPRGVTRSCASPRAAARPDRVPPRSGR
ncbi:MAG: phosphoribosyltransferase [Planctomycetia bacterium]|nr:phosphoribosyltransferase [Planctomycetia bacterium]